MGHNRTNSEIKSERMPRKFRTWAGAFLILVTVAVVIGLSNLFAGRESMQVIVNQSVPATELADAVSSTQWTLEDIKPDVSAERTRKEEIKRYIGLFSFHYNGRRFFYEENPQLPDLRRYVTVYAQDYRNFPNKREIIRQVYTGLDGWEFPQFYKTSHPGVVVLAAPYGEHYYIDLNTEKVILKIIDPENAFTETDKLVITDKDNKDWVIDLLVVDNCGESSDWAEGSGTFKGLTLNDELQNVAIQALDLVCIDSESGPWYSPWPETNFLGVNDDLSKIFFSVRVVDEYTNIVWQEHYSLDLNTKSLTKENLGVLFVIPREAYDLFPSP